MPDKLSSSDSIADRANTFPWPPVLFIAAIACALGAQSVQPIAWPGLDDTPARVVGSIFGVVGIGLIASAIATLTQSGTTVMPDKTSTKLVTTGPYQWLRNPIYLGEVLILLFCAEFSKNIWFLLTALWFAILVTWLQIKPEERHLERQFGDEYRTYKDRTRRWI